MTKKFVYRDCAVVISCKLQIDTATISIHAISKNQEKDYRITYYVPPYQVPEKIMVDEIQKQERLAIAYIERQKYIYDSKEQIDERLINLGFK